MYDCLNSVKPVKTDDRNCMSYMYLYNLYTSYFPNVHIRSLIRVFGVCSMNSQASNVFSGRKLRLCLDCMNVLN